MAGGVITHPKNMTMSVEVIGSTLIVIKPNDDQYRMEQRFIDDVREQLCVALKPAKTHILLSPITSTDVIYVDTSTCCPPHHPDYVEVRENASELVMKAVSAVLYSRTWIWDFVPAEPTHRWVPAVS